MKKHRSTQSTVTPMDKVYTIIEINTIYFLATILTLALISTL